MQRRPGSIAIVVRAWTDGAGFRARLLRLDRLDVSDSVVVDSVEAATQQVRLWLATVLDEAEDETQA